MPARQMTYVRWGCGHQQRTLTDASTRRGLMLVTDRGTRMPCPECHQRERVAVISWQVARRVY